MPVNDLRDSDFPDFVPGICAHPLIAARGTKKLISIVTPTLNEQDSIEAFYVAVAAVMLAESERYDFEVVITDNHSTDRTFEMLRELAGRDSRIRAYRFSRNFGYQRSIYTGLMLARGDAAVELDCDLQDPPSIIRDFLRLWESGHLVVYGIRRSRKEGLFITSSRRVFYWLVDSLSDAELPQGAGDFRLIDRRIIEELRKIRDPAIYLRGRVAMMGFNQVGIEYDREERTHGNTKFSFRHNFRLAMDAITSHSAIPLRVATYFGCAVTCLTGLGVPIYVVMYLKSKASWPPGFATLLFVSLGSLGIFSLFLGIIGEYLGRLYEHVKALPEAIIENATESEWPQCPDLMSKANKRRDESPMNCQERPPEQRS